MSEGQARSFQTAQAQARWFQTPQARLFQTPKAQAGSWRVAATRARWSHMRAPTHSFRTESSEGAGPVAPAAARAPEWALGQVEWWLEEWAAPR
jgi:hypothetical protein